MNEELWNKVLNYIEQHIYEKVSLVELADLAGYSPFYFSKLFTEAMGMPVTAYIRIRKLQYAIVSLLEGKKVMEVSLMYAFDSHEGFTRAFTQLFGSTPSKVRKYLEDYQVPEIVIPNVGKGRGMTEMRMQDNLRENRQQLILEVIRESIKEANEGFCTKIEIEYLKDGVVKVADNGRGIPLSKDMQASTELLNKILHGRPITAIEYSQMGDFSLAGLQTVNSLCESLQVKVYREGLVFQQDYVRGVAQHELLIAELQHASGMEMIFKPDRAIFGEE